MVSIAKCIYCKLRICKVNKRNSKYQMCSYLTVNELILAQMKHLYNTSFSNCKIIKKSPPEPKYFHPKSSFIQDFVDSINILA